MDENQSVEELEKLIADIQRQKQEIEKEITDLKNLFIDIVRTRHLND